MQRFVFCLLSLFAVSCSGSSTNSTGSSGGAAAQTGGTSTAGGSGATGGASTTGTLAAGNGAVGGTPAIGGSTTMSGTTTAGGGTTAAGNSATGGASASGGTTTSGGKTATGGTSANGGQSALTGGTSANGGQSTSAGGMSTTGGKSASAGGTPATGGSSTSGGTLSTGGGSSTGATHWVGTWTASPYVDTNSSNTPPISLSNSVIRQVTHVSLGGSQIRVQFSNLWGNGSLAISGAHIALCKATPAVDSTIDTTTDKALTFSGAATVTIAQGKEVWSDPIDFAVPNRGNITITMALGSVPSTLTQHSGSRTTSYFQSGGTTANLNAANMTSATTKALWFFISGIDVMADATAKGAVAIGDSITDGRGTDTDNNNRWTDDLATRLLGNTATANVSMMNQGIGATNLAGSASTTAQSRFARDVLGQSGVKYAIVLDGINDIIADTSYATLKSAYDSLISQAHAKGLLIFGATITPFGAYTSGFSTARESVRQQVNTYIKSGVFDGYLDFDAAITDGGSPPKIQSIYATWAQTDGLHPNPAGYQKMADSVDLSLFTK